MPSALDTSTHPHREYRCYNGGEDVDLTDVISGQAFARTITMLGPGKISVEWITGNVMTEDYDQGQLDAGGGKFVAFAKRILPATTARLEVGF